MRDGAGLSVNKGQHMSVCVKVGAFFASSRVAPQDFSILSQQSILQGQDFLFPCETLFRREELALIALGSRGNASFGRREGSRGSPQGVFPTAEPRRKQILYLQSADSKNTAARENSLLFLGGKEMKLYTKRWRPRA